MKGIITEDKKYRAELSIGSYQVDARGQLRPGAFMDLAQEMAYQTSTAMHFGYDDLQKNQFVWVLARMQIEFVRRPDWNERVDFATWCKREETVFFLRDFLMSDSEGNPLVKATTSWTVINSETRAMVRGEAVKDIVSDQWLCADSVFDAAAPKIALPAGQEPVIAGVRRVSYSDIDVVGHANNARYMSWAMDSIDYDYIMTHRLVRAALNFNHECRAGELIELRRWSQDDRWTVAGFVGGRQSFIVQLEFE